MKKDDRKFFVILANFCNNLRNVRIALASVKVFEMVSESDLEREEEKRK